MPIASYTRTPRFGLVTVPVKLHSATQPKGVRFHLMDREGRRVRYRRVVEDAPTARVVDTPVDLYDGPSDGPTVAPREERAPAPSERAATRPETEVEFHELVRG